MDLIVRADDGIGRAALQTLGAANAEPFVDMRHHLLPVLDPRKINADTEQ
jgi:hypothetical protein